MGRTADGSALKLATTRSRDPVDSTLRFESVATGFPFLSLGGESWATTVQLLKLTSEPDDGKSSKALDALGHEFPLETYSRESYGSTDFVYGFTEKSNS
jgi:hypothetical protein